MADYRPEVIVPTRAAVRAVRFLGLLSALSLLTGCLLGAFLSLPPWSQAVVAIGISAIAWGLWCLWIREA